VAGEQQLHARSTHSRALCAGTPLLLPGKGLRRAAHRPTLQQLATHPLCDSRARRHTHTHESVNTAQSRISRGSSLITSSTVSSASGWTSCAAALTIVATVGGARVALGKGFLKLTLPAHPTQAHTHTYVMQRSAKQASPRHACATSSLVCELSKHTRPGKAGRDA
jgi:hypothetical protein